jgi:AcrR family transcriptional regulator
MARVGAELRRRDFVEATVRVIAEHGAAGATTRRIAAEVGCPLATLHYVFHTKEDLFYAVYESLLEEAQSLTSGQDRRLPLRDAAPAHLHHLMQWMVGNRPFARAQAELFNWLLRFNPAMAQRTYEQALDLARAALRESGAGKHQVDQVARLFMALFDGMLNAWFSHADDRQLMADTEVACRALAALADGLPAVAAPTPRRSRRHSAPA